MKKYFLFLPVIVIGIVIFFSFPKSKTDKIMPQTHPTPSPVLNSLSIMYMRNQSYPGSQITIVKELPSGENYSQYLAYYVSEGLKINALLTVPIGVKPKN